MHTHTSMHRYSCTEPAHFYSAIYICLYTCLLAHTHTYEHIGWLYNVYEVGRVPAPPVAGTTTYQCIGVLNQRPMGAPRHAIMCISFWTLAWLVGPTTYTFKGLWITKMVFNCRLSNSNLRRTSRRNEVRCSHPRIRDVPAIAPRRNTCKRNDHLNLHLTLDLPLLLI